MTETKGIWHNGMYIPPDLVEGFIKDLEGRPVTLGENGPIVGTIANIKQVGDCLSVDISKSEESQKLLDHIQSLMSNTIEITHTSDSSSQ